MIIKNHFCVKFTQKFELKATFYSKSCVNLHIIFCSAPVCRMPNNDPTSFHLHMGSSQVFGSNSAVLHVFRKRVREGRVKHSHKRLPVASYNNNQKATS